MSFIRYFLALCVITFLIIKGIDFISDEKNCSYIYYNLKQIFLKQPYYIEKYIEIICILFIFILVLLLL